MATTTWECPRCHRRVPLRVAECHCGTPRPEAGAARPLAGPSLSGAARHVPRGVWVWVGVIVVTALLGIYWAFRPAEPNRIIPLLGRVDRPPQPPPSPKAPTPRPN